MVTFAVNRPRWTNHRRSYQCTTVDQSDIQVTAPQVDASDKRLATPRPRWRRRAVIVIAVGIALWLVHVPLFRGVGGFLVAEEPLAKADYIVILPALAGDSVALEPAIQRVRRGEAGGLLFFKCRRRAASAAGPGPTMSPRSELF